MTIEGIDHVQLAMPAGQEDTARAFYSGLLGIPEVAKPPELAKRGGVWFESDQVKVHLGVDPDFRPAKKAHPGLVVHELQDLVRQLREAGFEVNEAEPLSNSSRVHLFDPFGNRIELIEEIRHVRRSKIDPVEFNLEEGGPLLVREVELGDAAAMLEYVETISAESDFLSFGPGQHGFTESEEQEFIRDSLATANRLFLIGLIEETIVAALSFAGGPRPRTAHTGEFGMSVRKSHWGRGIGSIMLDVLIEWGRKSDTLRKINLRVRTDNRRAIELYLRKGFKKEGTISREVCINGKFLDHHWMGLNV